MSVPRIGQGIRSLSGSPLQRETVAFAVGGHACGLGNPSGRHLWLRRLSVERDSMPWETWSRPGHLRNGVWSIRWQYLEGIQKRGIQREMDRFG